MRSAATWVRTAAFACLWAAAATCGATEKELERTGGPFVPTPQVVVDAMLSIARVGPEDFVIDLGSGNGVIVLTAATRFKAAGYGVDIDPDLVTSSNAEAQRLGVADRARFLVQDIFKADLSRATVITLYLLPSMMMNLRPKIFLEAKPGTRVVSHDYNFDEWHPDDQLVLDVPEKEKVTGTPRTTINLWIVPAKVGGTWRVEIEGREHYQMTLRQKYQAVSGSANAQGRNAQLTYASLEADRIHFAIMDGGARRVFNGRVNGDAMEGTVEIDAKRSARWVARRI